ncbi:uncharacterized protein LOC143283089 [Babylonia areolata]|uniref:uncharacterized protein LOC143283089 n=1 Tax=Babylonia areolata TaxID=304850 RepID=UPI003FD05B9E
MADDEEFEEQLEQEQKAKVEEEEKEAVHQGLTYTDSDGTVMEWDPLRKAYFPQIDNDFIARYQMSYGTDSSSQASSEQTAATANPADATADSNQTWQDYYNYYNYHSTSESGSKEGEAEGKDEKEYTTADYYAYYAYYYGEDYAQKWLNSRMEEEEEAEEARKEEEAKKAGEEKKGEEGVKEEEKDSKGKQKKGKEKEGVKRKAPEQPPAWFDMDTEKSTHVYVSGLPSDLTEEEYKELMSKCGLIMFDPHTRKPKLKLYRNPDGTLKGDGLCCYIKQESVELALNILDGSNVHGSTISVERAKFEMKGNFDPSKKKKKLSNKAKRKLKEKQEKLFDWRPDKDPTTRMRFERIIVLKNMFEIKEFEEDPSLINDLRDDVRTECAKFGDVRKVQVHDRHPEGAISVTFRTPEEGDLCVAALNGRWFAKRQIQAATYDGKTQYEVKETDAEREERLRGWEAFIATDPGSKASASTGSDSGQQTAGSRQTPRQGSSGSSSADNVCVGGGGSGDSGASGASSEVTETVGVSGGGGGGARAEGSPMLQDSQGGAAN